MPTGRPGARSAILLAVGALCLPAACSPGTPDVEGISEQAFVQTYVDLRMTTLRMGVDQIPVEERDRILQEHGVGEQDLLDFVEIHGRNPEFMHAVWDSIEFKIDALRIVPTGPQAPLDTTPQTQSPDSSGETSPPN